MFIDGASLRFCKSPSGAQCRSSSRNKLSHRSELLRHLSFRKTDSSVTSPPVTEFVRIKRRAPQSYQRAEARPSSSAKQTAHSRTPATADGERKRVAMTLPERAPIPVSIVAPRWRCITAIGRSASVPRLIPIAVARKRPPVALAGHHRKCRTRKQYDTHQ